MVARWLIRIALGSAIVIPTVLAAQAVPDAELSHGTLAFDAKATLGAFTGTTTTLTGHLVGAPTLAGARGWVEAPARTLNTKNGHRDRDMAGSLEFDKYATIRFDLESVTPGAVSGDSTTVTLHGRFTIHGQTRPAAIPGWIWWSAKTIRFRGAVPMNVKDYGVGGLSKMLGVLKMKEMIVVRVDVMFEER